MSHRDREFGKGGGKGKHAVTFSNDQSPTSKYESVPMFDMTTKKRATNNTLCEQQSPESKGQPQKEDIKKWMRENIKLRPHQVTSKKSGKWLGVKNKIVQPIIPRAEKSREVIEKDENSGSEDEWISSSPPPPPPPISLQLLSYLPQPSSSLLQPISSPLQLPQPPSFLK
ncbi:formin-E [Octopus bimaculoides]|uniref:Uncharacterized protein n=1 Tax=Octopus bimaculoides TaxID=37653 RepID=A0A0L8GGZ8_OCTBM|nr:formin-E [Octopus bimaculoides]XP_052830057.1 formin-E [Octopus bimaculoides]|eukprot:XP_014781146.1 PREDICTED: formin-E-like [Octopus bimaculoides]